jgi:hypothetical protein
MRITRGSEIRLTSLLGVTGWFWLGVGSSAVIVILAAYRLLTLRKANGPD